jgi:hypothetical protein
VFGFRFRLKFFRTFCRRFVHVRCVDPPPHELPLELLQQAAVYARMTAFYVATAMMAVLV